MRQGTNERLRLGGVGCTTSPTAAYEDEQGRVEFVERRRGGEEDREDYLWTRTEKGRTLLGRDCDKRRVSGME